jgi:DNA-binding transcriptional LysR family regulator
MIAVASPDCFEHHPGPVMPQDLTGHTCINLRLPTEGGLYAWEFEKDGQELRVRVDGQLTSNGITQVLQMALDGYGIAFVPEGPALPDIEAGHLVQSSKTRARTIRATIFIIHRAGSSRQHSPWFSRPCASAVNTSLLATIGRRPPTFAI